jgi:uncharacterized membrane protein YbhN (UPF0104 family)
MNLSDPRDQTTPEVGISLQEATLSDSHNFNILVVAFIAAAAAVIVVVVVGVAGVKWFCNRRRARFKSGGKRIFLSALIQMVRVCAMPFVSGRLLLEEYLCQLL